MQVLIGMLVFSFPMYGFSFKAYIFVFCVWPSADCVQKMCIRMRVFLNGVRCIRASVSELC